MKFTESESQSWELTVRKLGTVPMDTVGVLAYTVGIDLVVIGEVFSPPVRAALVLPLLFFLPGFALLWALYPDVPTSSGERSRVVFETTTSDSSGFGILGRGPPGTLERTALSFGASLAFVPIVSILLGVTGLPVSTGPILSILTLAIGAGVVVGSVRRRTVPSHRQFAVRVRPAIARVLHFVRDAPTVEVVLSVALVACVTMAGTALTAGVLADNSGETYTELALFTETESGRLVEGGYPTEFTVGQPRDLTVAVDNHEGSTTRYTVVASLQRVDARGSDVEVLERARLDQFSETVAPGERWTTTHAVDPAMEGDELRLVYLLYRGDPPATPTVENAYRHVFLWVNVTAAGGR